MEREQWPTPAREMATNVEAGLAAAAIADRDGFDAALVLMLRGNREQLAVLLGTMTTDLLEAAHPDGLDAESAEALLIGTRERTRPWFTDVDDDLLLQALTSVLGIDRPEDAPSADPDLVLAHGVLLIAELSRTTRTSSEAAVEAAMADIVRAQTMEMP